MMARHRGDKASPPYVICAIDNTASLSSSRAWHIQICMLASTLWACSLGVFRIDRNEIKSRSNQIAKDVDVDVDLSSATMQFS